MGQQQITLQVNGESHPLELHGDQTLLAVLRDKLELFGTRGACGIGMCGRCNIGKELVCKDGPVFTLEEINQTPKEY